MNTKKQSLNRASGLSKVIPKSRLDIYSPRRAFQQNPYKSYWMSCIEKLLEAASPFDEEQPGYYKLVCNNLQKDLLDSNSLPELSAG